MRVSPADGGLRALSEWVHSKLPPPCAIAREDVLRLLLKLRRPERIRYLYYSRIDISSVTAVLAVLSRAGLLHCSPTDLTIRLAAGADACTARAPDPPRASLPLPERLHFVDRTNVGGPALDELREALESTPHSRTANFWQSRIDFDCLERRFSIIETFDDWRKKRVIMLGDDSSFALYYALRVPDAEIAVVDVDKSLLEFTGGLARRLGIRIDLVHCDLRAGFPRELEGRHDLFIASGYKDLGGLLLFIARGLIALDDQQPTAGYVTYGTYDYDGKGVLTSAFELQKKLTRFGCVLTSIAPCDAAVLPRKLEQRYMEFVLSAADASENVSWSALVEGLRVPEALLPEAAWAQLPIYPAMTLEPVQFARLVPIGAPSRHVRQYAALASSWSRRA